MTDIADKIYAATGLTLGAEAAAKIGQMIQQARHDALKEAAQRAAHYERMAYQHGNLPVDDPHECAAQVAREIEASICALGEKE
jgi:hypothetical protein